MAFAMSRLKSELGRIINDLNLLLEFEMPESLEHQNKLLHEQLIKTENVVKKLKLENDQLKLEIARVGLEYGRNQKDQK